MELFRAALACNHATLLKLVRDQPVASRTIATLERHIGVTSKVAALVLEERVGHPLHDALAKDLLRQLERAAQKQDELEFGILERQLHTLIIARAQGLDELSDTLEGIGRRAKSWRRSQ